MVFGANRVDQPPAKVIVGRMIEPSEAAARAAAETPPHLPVRTAPDAPPRQSPPDRSLDQWRGLALVLVLISHGFFFTGLVPGIGRAGVNLFFFISGILVFRSLARGPQTWWPGAGYFWIRRTKRLVPAKYFYLLCITLVVVLPVLPMVTSAFRTSFFRGLPSSFLYYRNYYLGDLNDLGNARTPENLTGHLWSLACEMQFYALAPLIFFAGGGTIRRRAAVYGVILVLFLVGGCSVLVKPPDNPYTFGVAAWPMMAGFAAQFLLDAFPRPFRACGRTLAWIGLLSLLVLAVWLAVLCLRVMGVPLPSLQKYAIVLAGTLLLPGCFGCYLEGIAPPGFLGNSFHWLGNRTYSIYLWQQPFTIGGLVPHAYHPLGSLLAIPVGGLSFRFLERPFMSKYKPGKAVQ
jgi:peptidoglycan/LPS O-acetylase OafA/YrhL